MTEVTTTAGAVRGVEADGVHAFKGIPYAAAPAGGLRLRRPVAPEPWEGVRDATHYGLTAVQQPMPGIFGELGTPQSPAGDDCLNVNVWTPDPGAAGLPVLLWIHGGAFYAGSGVDDVYDGTAFARDGIVCATINYRLGVQGFWHLGEHFAELEDSGNIGMLDQIASLKWVQENIAAFGGDPSRVTIAGESAGGMSVSTLMAMPEAKGLFHQAIPQSGAAHNGISAPTASMIGGHILDMLGVAPGDIEGLDRVPSAIMLDAQTKLGDELAETRDPSRFGEAAASAMAFQPTWGTAALPERPIDAITAGAASDIGVMIGTTMEEALIFLVDLKDMFNDELVQATMDGVFGMAGKDGDAALAAYRASLAADAEPHEVVAAIETDRMFIVPAIRMADAQSEHNQDIWMYRFDWRTPAGGGAWGAHHFLEVPFVFDRLDNPQAHGFVGDSPPQSLADACHAAWSNFIKNGDPNNGLLPDWPRYNSVDRPTMLFDESSQLAHRPGDDRVALWQGVI